MIYLHGDIPEPFTLPAAGGGRVTVTPGEHSATVLIWTCNHCPYALAWHERIQDVIRDYQDRDVSFYQINTNNSITHPDDSFPKMEERVAAGEFASPYLHDAEQSLSKRWAARVTPDVFVLDGEGRIVFRGAPDADHGDPEQNASYIRDVIDDVLNERPVRMSGTKASGCKIKWIVDDQPNPYV